ncbi:hypothetical protein BCV69DRAFT_265234 [Microstroma glucosiphilum]|uniref:Uncharacterized protein n=1 Tax=Pseudomicrostroma glucosiphilum TaxID=1684307 RepID=A0A316UF71_9BASI|nr:hypothetical protein BCV69DRAFT_265234 [Pseudomicrostroma glucosiphilum]PWN23892.1 hypothetical protein BCV69DRAFT_265234 [Pseudomicrostroma glucosiphilum]
MPHKRAKRSVRVAKRDERGNDLVPPKASKDVHMTGLPKNAMRILNAGKVQAEYNARRKAIKEGTYVPSDDPSSSSSVKGKGKAKARPAKAAVSPADELRIRPGEKLGDFNRRVEQTMAGVVAATARTEARREKKRKRSELDRKKGGEEDDEEGEGSGTSRQTRAQKAKEIEESQPSSKDLKRAREELQGQSGGRELDFAKASQVRRVNDVAQAPPRFTKLPRGESIEARARKAKVSAAIQGQDPDEAARLIRAAKGERTVTKGQMPEPIKKQATVPVGGLRREKELREERERMIRMYRLKKSAREGQKEFDR